MKWLSRKYLAPGKLNGAPIPYRYAAPTPYSPATLSELVDESGEDRLHR